MTVQDKILIQAYIDQTLSDEQLQLFKERLEDETFAKEWAFQLSLLEELKNSEHIKLKKQYKDLLNKKLKANDPKTKNRLKFLWIGLLLLAFLALIFGKTIFGSSEEEKLFARFYSPLPAVEIQRGMESGDQSYIKALKTYQSENYPAAMAQFKDLIEKDPMSSNYKLYGGISALALNQTDQALGLLTQVWVTGDKIMRQHAEWYYTLALLRKGNIEETKEQAVRIVEDQNHLYRNMAGLLVKELN